MYPMFHSLETLDNRSTDDTHAFSRVDNQSHLFLHGRSREMTKKTGDFVQMVGGALLSSCLQRTVQLCDGVGPVEDTIRRL